MRTAERTLETTPPVRAKTRTYQRGWRHLGLHAHRGDLPDTRLSCAPRFLDRLAGVCAGVPSELMPASSWTRMPVELRLHSTGGSLAFHYQRRDRPPPNTRQVLNRSWGQQLEDTAAVSPPLMIEARSANSRCAFRRRGCGYTGQAVGEVALQFVGPVGSHPVERAAQNAKHEWWASRVLVVARGPEKVVVGHIFITTSSVIGRERRPDVRWPESEGGGRQESEGVADVNKQWTRWRSTISAGV